MERQVTTIVLYESFMSRRGGTLDSCIIASLGLELVCRITYLVAGSVARAIAAFQPLASSWRSTVSPEAWIDVDVSDICMVENRLGG